MRAGPSSGSQFGKRTRLYWARQDFSWSRRGNRGPYIQEAFRLSPRDIYAYRWMLFVAAAKLQLNADAEAVIWSRRSIEANPNWPLSHFFLAASLALLGSLDEARAAARVGLAFDPGFTIRRFRDGASNDNPIFLAKRERFYEGMRLAGVPEG